MCSFLITYLEAQIGKDALARLMNRGPDVTNSYEYENYVFTHFLLHITGVLSPQPFVEDGVVIVYNGEIYEHDDAELPSVKDYTSDGLCLMPMYRKYGENFMNHLNGEYAICVYDFNRNIAILSTDIFGTKPLWYSMTGGHLQVSSHRSALSDCSSELNIERLSHNTRLIFDLKKGQVVEVTNNLYKFDLTQTKKTYDDWIHAFLRAIQKRTDRLIHPIFVCLSSGYDSGAICCALDRLKIRYQTYTIRASENQKILDRRLSIHNDTTNTTTNTILRITSDDYSKIKTDILQRCEHNRDKILLHCDQIITKKSVKTGKGMIVYDKHPYQNGDRIIVRHIHGQKFPISEGSYFVIKYNEHRFRLSRKKGHVDRKDAISFSAIDSDYQFAIERKGCTGRVKYYKKYDPLKDWASVGLGKIFCEARKKGQLIYLSGQGGDEIYADYGHAGKKFKSCSIFGGKFPDDLTRIFPWKTFFESTQRAFIDKEESIAGGYGIESRYPFLDRDVVQEFLWLSPELKNRYYKAPLHTLMTKYRYPFQVNEKIGFKAHRDK